MLADYIRAALARSESKQLEDGSWLAKIPGFEGVWANAASVEACRSEQSEEGANRGPRRPRQRAPLPSNTTSTVWSKALYGDRGFMCPETMTVPAAPVTAAVRDFSA